MIGEGGGGRAMAFKKMGLGEGEGLWLLKRWDWGRDEGCGFQKDGIGGGGRGEGCKNLVLNSGGHHLTKKGKSQRIMKFIEASKKYACHCSIHAFIRWVFKNRVMCITSKQAKLKQSLRLGLLLVILGAKSKALAHNKTTLCLFQDLFC